jgi:hypothetical protein
MATIERRETERGFWFDIKGKDGIRLSAHRVDDEGGTPLTLFWRGRTEVDPLAVFFDAASLDDVAITVQAVAFTENGRIALTDFKSAEDILEQLPADLRFLRLECIPRDGDPFDGSDRFIVWSRVGLKDFPEGSSAPEDIGVFLGPTRLRKIQPVVADFVSKTHRLGKASRDVKDCIAALADYVTRGEPRSVGA